MVSDLCTYPKCECPKWHFDLDNNGKPYSCPKRYVGTKDQPMGRPKAGKTNTQTEFKDDF